MSNTIEKDKTIHQRGVFSFLKSFIERNRLGELLIMKGAITPHDLKYALNIQKQTNRPLGQVFIDQQYITKSQLRRLLIRQNVLRCAATSMFFFASISAAPKKSRADMIKDIPAQISLTQNAGFTNIASYPALFGTDEKRSVNIKPFTKWTGMFAKFERELSNDSSRKIINEWQKEISAYKSLPMKSMVDKVNRLVNKQRYIVDQANWGKSDYWATPVEFLQRGGDCEDFAIAKYTALRTLGVPESRMRLAIVHDNEKNIPHAVLIVYTDQGSYILDNQEERLVSAERSTRYRAIFSINRTAWWLHTAPATTLVASVR